MLWHCMFQKHHTTFTTFFSERIIWGIQQVTTKNPEKTVLEKTLQRTVYDTTYIVYMGEFWAKCNEWYLQENNASSKNDR